ncbi:hypothetical protein TTHERM_01068230 (macronuclear) [Tetrahymena thermophila SB210]|uniref:Uncharacterized protein n=1 Tax=Tetrahymena thermophila (strain SB210) TaxID=312017 RepID=Q22C87_TETTS|nr:hypothetical protein TTHERM_01068230 [Tetrahymena thermophila SB210]EAR82920.2 hypothetical protein TTHERM_01068230 [Tetrahymena thermophila SB210]|eukprot:XP_001030583.2 hypothetical protein TTHERM_01068230 [Tetrahymena thermophila SB210]
MSAVKKQPKQISLETFLNLEDQVTSEDLYNIDYFFQHANSKLIKERFQEKEFIDWKELKQSIIFNEEANHNNIFDVNSRKLSSESFFDDEVDEFELKIHCKKNHLILLLDVSPSMFKYDYITNSLNIQNLEIICKSLLDHILEAAHKSSEQDHRKQSLDDQNGNQQQQQESEGQNQNKYSSYYKQRTRITVYLFGMTNKELELVVNYVLLSKHNINDIYKQILKSILDNCNKMSNRTSNSKSSRQTSPKYSPVNTYTKQNGNSVTRLSGGSDCLQSYTLNEKKYSIDMVEAISRIQQSLIIHGERMSFSKLVVITDGICFNVDDEKFYQQISRSVKPIGFSCHILLTGKSQLNRENQFGYIVDEDMLRFMAQKMNGEFHFLTVHDQVTNNNKTKNQYAYFACCKSPQSDFSKKIQQMLMTWTLRYNIKEFKFSFSSPKSRNSSAKQSILSSCQSIKEESSFRGIFEDRDEDQCTIMYIEESKDEYNLKFRKIIKMVHKYDLKPHVSQQVDYERLYQICKIRHLEGWKMIRVQKKDNFIMGYEYRVNLQAKLYYLVKCVNSKIKIQIFQDVPAISYRNKREQGYKTPEYIINISKKLEQYDQFAFNAFNLMQYNFESSNKKQTKILCNSKVHKEINSREDKKVPFKDQEELWEKYYKVKTLTFLQIPKDKVCKDNIMNIRNKFAQEVYERVSYVADKNITKNKFYLKINKDFVHLLEENKDKVATMVHQQSAQQTQGDKAALSLSQKVFSVDENLMDYGKLLTLESQDSDGVKNGLIGLQHRTSQGYSQTNQQIQTNTSNQFNPIKSLAFIKVSIKNFYITEIKLAFQNYPKAQQKQLVKEIKKTIHNYNFESFDISVISNSINQLLYMGQSIIYPFQEASNLTKSWQWTQECIHDLKNFYSILASLRNNGQFKSIQQNRSQYKETIFLTEVQFSRTENKSKIKRLLIAHIITFKKNYIEVKIVCENALDLVQIPGKSYQTAQKVLQQYINHIYQQEEKILKRLYTVHTVHRHAIAKRKDSNNQDVFVGIVLDSLKSHMLTHLNMGISLLRDDTESIKDISSYKKHLENIIKEEYQKFDVNKENFIDYSALFQNSYLKKTFSFSQIEGATQQDQEKLKQYNQLFYQRCLEYIQQNNDHSIMNSKKNYLIDIKENQKGYINSKFLDYKIILITLLCSDDESSQSNQQNNQSDYNTTKTSSKIGLSNQANTSNSSSSNSTFNTYPNQGQNSFNYSPKLKPNQKDATQAEINNLNKRDLTKESSNKKIETAAQPQQNQQQPHVSSFSIDSNKKQTSSRFQFKIDFYLMDIKSCENNTNPTSRDFEKYNKGVDQYIEQLMKQISHFYSQTCFEAIAAKQVRLNSLSIEEAIHNSGIQSQIQQIPLKDFMTVYSWFHRDFATQKKKNNNQNQVSMNLGLNINNNNSIINQMNNRNNSQYHQMHHHHHQQQQQQQQNNNLSAISNQQKSQIPQSNSNSMINEDMNYLVNQKFLDDEILIIDQKNLNGQQNASQIKKQENEINPFEQFDNLVLTKAQKIFDIVVNSFFSNIPDTSYYFTDQKKAEELRRNDPQDYELATEFLPNLNQTIPKIFMKIKYNLGGQSRCFSSFKETFMQMITEQQKDKENNYIQFEFYQIQSDLFKDKQQQMSALGSDTQPQSNTATKKTHNFFFDFKLACSSIIKVTNLEYFMMNTPLYKDDVEKIIKLIQESKQNYQRVYEIERKKLINLDDHKLLDHPKNQEILINEISEASNQGCLHLKKVSNSLIFYQIFQSPQDEECQLLEYDTRELLKRLNQYTNFIVPFWFFLIFKPDKVEVHFNPISFLSSSQSHFVRIQHEINQFIQRAYQRANTVILILEMKRTQFCPQNLEIKGAAMQKHENKQTGAQNKIKNQQFYQQFNQKFNLSKARAENKESAQDKMDNNSKYKVDLLDTLFFPIQEKEEFTTFINNMVFNNFRVHNTSNTYLYFEKEEIYIICFQDITQHQLQQLQHSQEQNHNLHTIQQSSQQQGQNLFVTSITSINPLSSQQNDSFISQNQNGSQAADGSFIQQALAPFQQKGSLVSNQFQSFSMVSQTTAIKGPLSKYYTTDQYNKGKKFINIEIYGMNSKYFKDAQEAICIQVIQAQTLETIKKVSGKLSEIIKIPKSDYDQILESSYRKKFRYKFPSFIVDHASFMYYFKQNIQKIMNKFTVLQNSNNRPSALDHTKESLESQIDVQNVNPNTPKKENQQFDQFLTDNYGEMKVVKVQYEKNDFRFLFNGQSSRKIFGICMFLMNVVLQRKKQTREMEEVNHFYPIVPLKQLQDNQKLGINAIETISLGCGYSQNDWDDQSSFVYNFLANNQQIDSFKPPDIYNYIDNKYIKETNSDFKIELASEIITQEEYFLDLEIRNKGTVEQEKLINYLTVTLNQICLDYLFETILQRSIVTNLDEKNQNKRVQQDYFYKSCLNAEKLFTKLNHKSFFMQYQKYQHKFYHNIWPSYLKYCSALLEKEILEKCKINEQNINFPSIYVIDDGLGYAQIFEHYNDMEIYFLGNYKNSIQIIKKPPQISYIICGNLLKQGIRDGKFDKNMMNIFEKLKEDKAVQLSPVEKQDFDIFTQRNFYARISIQQKSLELKFYNLNRSIIKQMNDYMETLFNWSNCRYHIQKHVFLQKLGVYTYFSQYTVPKQKTQNQSFIDEIHKILTQEEKADFGDLGDATNYKNFLRVREQDLNEKRAKEGNTQKLTEYISTLTYNVFPQKGRESMIDMFQKHYNNFLTVSFRIIKPKFTKSHYNKKQNDDGNIDSLIIHGGPFLNFVQDYYINDYNKQFFKFMRTNCQSGNQKLIDFQLIKKFLNGADLVRNDICPIIVIIADNNQFNHWKRKEVDESDVVGDHLEFLEKEENKKLINAYQLFQDIYIEQIQKLVEKATYTVKQKLDVLLSDYQSDPSQSFVTLKKNFSQLENDRFQIQKYKQVSLGQFMRVSQIEDQSSVQLINQSKESNMLNQKQLTKMQSFNDNKSNITILMKAESKTLFLVELQFKISEITQKVYYQSQDKTDQFELIHNQEINLFQSEFNITKETFDAHLNLINQILHSDQKDEYPEIDIVQTLNSLYIHYSDLIDLSKSQHIIESKVIKASLGFFNSQFNQKELIEFLDFNIKSKKISQFYNLGSNICMQIDSSIFSGLVTQKNNFYIFLNFLPDDKSFLNSQKMIQLQIENSQNTNEILYISYHVIVFDAKLTDTASREPIINNIHAEIEKQFRQILPKQKKSFISQDYYNKILAGDDKIYNEQIDLLQNNCQVILLQQKNPDFLKDIKDLQCFDHFFLEQLKWMFKMTKFTHRDRYNSYSILIPIQEDSVNFQGALLISINEKNQIDPEKIKCISINEVDEQNFISIMYTYLNEIILNWVYYLNEQPYQIEI